MRWRTRKRLQLIGVFQSSSRMVATLKRKNSTPLPEAFFFPSLQTWKMLEAVGGAERGRDKGGNSGRREGRYEGGGSGGN